MLEWLCFCMSIMYANRISWRALTGQGANRLMIQVRALHFRTQRIGCSILVWSTHSNYTHHREPACLVVSELRTCLLHGPIWVRTEAKGAL